MQAPLDPGALLLDDLGQAIPDLVQHAVEMGARQLLCAPLTELLEDAAQPRHVSAAGAVHPTLHEALQGPADVALGQDVVGERLEHIVGVKGRQALAAIPARVANHRHGGSAWRGLTMPPGSTSQGFVQHEPPDSGAPAGSGTWSAQRA